jgi:hypothetical protein
MTAREILVSDWLLFKKIFSSQVWFHLVKLFQMSRLKYEKLTNGRWTTDGRRTPSDGKSSLCLWQGKLKITGQSNDVFKVMKMPNKMK